jgi:phage terminase large subunit-like protein
MRTVSELIDQFGIVNAREYLLNFYQDEKNLKYFAALFPNHIQPPLPDYQHDIYSLVPNHDKLAIAAPRGSGKSTTVNMVILAYYALFNKSPFSLLVSDTVFQSRLQLEGLAHELEVNEAIQFLFGDVKGSTWGADDIIIRTRFGEAKISAKGAGQKIRGLKFREHRPHLIIIDDLENDELVESEDRRTKLENWFRFSLLRVLSLAGSKVIYLGTILHEHALLKKIIEHKEPYQSWECRLYPAIKEDGTSFWETRFPLTYLIDIRDNPAHPDYAGTLVFSQEYQNQPRSDADRIIKESWLREYHYAHQTEDWLKTLTIIGGVDPAISKEDSACFFVFTTIGIDKEGHVWHLETIRGKLSIMEQVKEILDGYVKWKHANIGIESIAYQKALSQLVKADGAKRSIYPKIKEIMTDKDKTRRLVAISSMFEGGFIHFNTDSSETENLKKETLTFPATPNDSLDSFMLAVETSKKPRVKAFTTQRPAGW